MLNFWATEKFDGVGVMLMGRDDTPLKQPKLLGIIENPYEIDQLINDLAQAKWRAHPQTRLADMERRHEWIGIVRDEHISGEAGIGRELASGGDACCGVASGEAGS